MRVKCQAQEHNTMTQPGLEPGPLDPEATASPLFCTDAPLKKLNLLDKSFNPIQTVGGGGGGGALEALPNFKVE